LCASTQTISIPLFIYFLSVIINGLEVATLTLSCGEKVVPKMNLLSQGNQKVVSKLNPHFLSSPMEDKPYFDTFNSFKSLKYIFLPNIFLLDQ